jgi:hypothetical protein
MVIANELLAFLLADNAIADERYAPNEESRLVYANLDKRNKVTNIEVIKR